MQVLFCSVPTLAISTIYCLWHQQMLRQQRRQRRLRERLTYMLWVMANQVH